MQTPGQLIRHLRTAAKISQVELAEKLDVGQNQISRWELGGANPSSIALLKIIEACGAEVRIKKTK